MIIVLLLAIAAALVWGYWKTWRALVGLWVEDRLLSGVLAVGVVVVIGALYLYLDSAFIFVFSLMIACPIFAADLPFKKEQKKSDGKSAAFDWTLS